MILFGRSLLERWRMFLRNCGARHNLLPQERTGRLTHRDSCLRVFCELLLPFRTPTEPHLYPSAAVAARGCMCTQFYVHPT
eukprot:6412797-Amphidinium_carterae.1